MQGTYSVQDSAHQEHQQRKPNIRPEVAEQPMVSTSLQKSDYPSVPIKYGSTLECGRRKGEVNTTAVEKRMTIVLPSMRHMKGGSIAEEKKNQRFVLVTCVLAVSR
jgi:hypothetical protein